MKVDNPLISIIVPVYNVEIYLSQCIDSIIKQTYANIEIILVDDGSTDNSGIICDEYKKKDNRIVVIHKTNGGLSDARNAGMKIASGDWIGFVDSDDYISLKMYEVLLRLCNKYEVEMACVTFDCFDDGSQPKSIERDINEAVIDSSRFLKSIIYGDKEVEHTFSVWDRIYSRSLIDGLEFPKGKCYEDVCFTGIVAVKAGRIAYRNEALYHYRLRNGSISHVEKRGGYDRKLISDRLPLQRQLIQYLRNENFDLIAKLAEVQYYQEFLCFAGMDCYLEYRKEIDNILDEWRPNFSSLIRLPVSIGEKFKIGIKAVFRSAMIRYYRRLYKKAE